jgi:hypothetical protein
MTKKLVRGGLFSALTVAGLLIMFVMLLWSFHLAKDFSGRYETQNFSKQFWSLFFAGGCLYLLGCLGLGAVTRSQAAIWTGIIAFASGVALTIFLMPLVDFEGWTGASAYALIGVLFAGAILLFISVGVKWLWQKFWKPTHIAAP